MKTLLFTSYIDMATNSNDVLIALIITSGVVLCVLIISVLMFALKHQKQEVAGPINECNKTDDKTDDKVNEKDLERKQFLVFCYQMASSIDAENKEIKEECWKFLKKNNEYVCKEN